MPASIRLFATPFYFMRHGVTDHNQARLIMGQRDVPLNDAGRGQAHAAAERLVGLGIAAVVASPLGRARETAEIVAARLGLPVDLCEGLKERRWGVLEGQPHHLRHSVETPQGAEPSEAFAERTLGALAGLAAPPPVLLVGHSGTCRVLRRHLGIADDPGPIPNAVPLRYARNGAGWCEAAVSPAGPRAPRNPGPGRPTPPRTAP